MVKKSSLPSKVCPVCNRPFKWRKKWKLVWKEVIYCSKKLREATGAGFKDCNLAIKEADGDLDKAVEILRIKGV